MAYEPKQGDIIYLDFDPQAGHEQKGRRPALVISNEVYQRKTGMAIVCPITNTIRAYPLHIEIPQGVGTTGVVMCEQIRSVDFEARNSTFKETAPKDLLSTVLHAVGLFF